MSKPNMSMKNEIQNKMTHLEARARCGLPEALKGNGATNPAGGG
jgi:hypothetical protein